MLSQFNFIQFIYIFPTIQGVVMKSIWNIIQRNFDVHAMFITKSQHVIHFIRGRENDIHYTILQGGNANKLRLYDGKYMYCMVNTHPAMGQIVCI